MNCNVLHSDVSVAFIFGPTNLKSIVTNQVITLD